MIKTLFLQATSLGGGTVHALMRRNRPGFRSSLRSPWPWYLTPIGSKKTYRTPGDHVRRRCVHRFVQLATGRNHRARNRAPGMTWSCDKRPNVPSEVEYLRFLLAHEA
jgi:hypothetical protein